MQSIVVDCAPITLGTYPTLFLTCSSILVVILCIIVNIAVRHKGGEINAISDSEAVKRQKVWCFYLFLFVFICVIGTSAKTRWTQYRLTLSLTSQSKCSGENEEINLKLE